MTTIPACRILLESVFRLVVSKDGQVMREASVTVKNPLDGGRAKAVYKQYDVGETVHAIRYTDFTIYEARVVAVGDEPSVISAFDLWVEQRLVVRFLDGFVQKMYAGDVGPG